MEITPRRRMQTMPRRWYSEASTTVTLVWVLLDVILAYPIDYLTYLNRRQSLACVADAERPDMLNKVNWHSTTTHMYTYTQ